MRFLHLSTSALFLAAVLSAAEPGQSLVKADRSFCVLAAQGSMIALDLSTQAVGKSTNSDVKQFAQRVLDDQNKVDTELKDLTIRKGVALDNATTRATVLKGTGDAFDRAYLKRMVAAQEKDVIAFEKARKEVADPEIRAFAEKTLPQLREQLQLARTLNQKR